MHDNVAASPRSPVSALRMIVAGMMRASTARARRRGRVSDGPCNAEYAALKAIVKERGLLARRPSYYVAMMVMIAAVIAAGAMIIAHTRGSSAVWLAAPILAFASGQLALLGHEAAHHAVFTTLRANERLCLITINVLNGGNFRWWVGSHNEHHARSNEREIDPDIDYPFLAFSEAQARDKPAAMRAFLVRQHWLAPIAMCFAGLSLRLYGIAHFMKHRARRVELAAAISFYLIYPALIVGALGVWRGILFMLLHQALYGLYLGSVTSVNHWGMPMPEPGERLDYLRQQVVTSRNLRSGVLADVWFGGLNRQIEHHLFPTMARDRLRTAQPIVRAFCASRGVPYHEVGILAGYGEMFRTLRRVARAVRDGAANPCR